jgi:hypothetical protein
MNAHLAVGFAIINGPAKWLAPFCNVLEQSNRSFIIHWYLLSTTRFRWCFYSVMIFKTSDLPKLRNNEYSQGNC